METVLYIIAIVIGVPMALAVISFLAGIRVLQSNEIGIKITLGKPAEKGVGPGGYYFTFWPIQILKRYTNEIMEFHLTVPSVITRMGAVAGYGNGAVEPAEINIICTLYAQFDVNQLNCTAKNTSGNNPQGIGDLIVPYTKDVIRAFASRVPWRLVNQERHHAAEWIIARLVGYDIHGEYPKSPYPKKIDVPKQGDDKNPDVFGENDPSDYPDDKNAPTRENLKNSSPFVQIGLINVSLAIEDINFTDEKTMRDALTAKERARLEAGATRERADAERYKLTEEGRGAAKARELMIAIIKENPELEALFTVREMAQGTSNTIMYQIPSGLADTMNKILGGNDVGKIFSNLPDDQKKAIVEALKAAAKGD